MGPGDLVWLVGRPSTADDVRQDQLEFRERSIELIDRRGLLPALQERAPPIVVEGVI